MAERITEGEKEKITFFDKEPEEVLELLGTSPKGLSSAEALDRLEKYGRNELEEKKKVSKWRKFLAQFKDFLVIILLFAAVISAAVGEYVDSIVIWAILIANAMLGYIQEARAEAAIEALKEMGAAKAHVERDGKRVDIFAHDLVPGDVIFLETGDRIPADGRIIESTNFRVDESALTGESVAVAKKSKVLKREPGQDIAVNDRKNMVFSSTIVTYGRAKVVVTHTGMNTQIGKIAEMLASQEEGMTPLQKKLDKFGKQLGIIILVICAIVFLGDWMRGEDILVSFLVAISLAVAAIPEGLPAIVTTTLAIGVQRMSKRNAIIRKLPATETLGCATTICSDKTGTLTRNEMTIRKLYYNLAFHEVSGSGYIPEGKVTMDGKEFTLENDPTLERTVLAGYLCNNAALVKDEKDRYQIQGDPTEGAFIVLGEKLGLMPEEVSAQYMRVMEGFFDSTRKRMSVVVQNTKENRLEAYMKGAPEIILDLCDKVMIDGQVRPLAEEDREKILAANTEMGTKALRVLGTAYKIMDPEDLDLSPEAVEKNMTFVALSGMIDPARPEVKGAVVTCKKAGIKVVMITGDHALTAKAIASDLGIIKTEGERVIVGSEIETLPEEDFWDCHVFARVAPEHKMRIVTALQDNGEVVAMTGDGVNDAPALKKADTGIAMGITGTDVAKEASSMILADDNFASIVASVEEGRGIYQNMKKFIAFLISCNIAEILVIFIGIMINLPLPLIAVQILWINLTTDGLPALALGADPFDMDIMERPPRDTKENIINKRLSISILVRGTIITIICLTLYFIQLELMNPLLAQYDLSPLVGLSDDAARNLTAGQFDAWGLKDLYEADPDFLLHLRDVANAGGSLTWHDLGEHHHLLRRPRTYIFATMLICEMLNSFNCKSERHSVFGRDLSGKPLINNNWWLIGAVLLSILMSVLIIYIPEGAAVFHLAPLVQWYDWILIIGASFLTVVGEEIIKWYYRKYVYPKRPGGY
ncbi:MAG: cation-translocating P-type ATPase [Promethearchaeota archaeon]